MKTLVESVLLEKHTTLPGVVTSVNYEEGLADVKPLLYDKRSDVKKFEYPEIGDVPIWTHSGNLGTARITVPIVVGDIVAIHFSERDTQSFIVGDGKTITDPFDLSAMGLYPLYVTPSVHPIKVSRPLDPTNVVIENNSSTITITPTGKIMITAVEIEMETIDLKVNGRTTLTGDVMVNGNLTSVGTLTNNGVNVGSTHTHPPATDPPA